jgi:recombination protein RecA
VTLADGTQEKIGKIVNQRMDVEVLSYNPASDRIEPRRVTNWFDNGNAEHFLQFTVEKSGGNGRSQFAATENHLIRTPGGWTPAGELATGDRVMVAESIRLSGQQWQVVLGGLMRIWRRTCVAGAVSASVWVMAPSRSSTWIGRPPF